MKNAKVRYQKNLPRSAAPIAAHDYHTRFTTKTQEVNESREKKARITMTPSTNHGDYSKELREILKAEWWLDLRDTGSTLESEDGSGVFETVASEEEYAGRWQSYHYAVTKSPDGRYWKWEYAMGLTENQDYTGPGDYETVKLVEVFPHEKVIVTTEWKTTPNE